MALAAWCSSPAWGLPGHPLRAGSPQAVPWGGSEEAGAAGRQDTLLRAMEETPELPDPLAGQSCTPQAPTGLAAVDFCECYGSGTPRWEGGDGCWLERGGAGSILTGQGPSCSTVLGPFLYSLVRSALPVPFVTQSPAAAGDHGAAWGC